MFADGQSMNELSPMVLLWFSESFKLDLLSSAHLYSTHSISFPNQQWSPSIGLVCIERTESQIISNMKQWSMNNSQSLWEGKKVDEN